MREIPQCMINRYQAVDELVEDLTGFLNRNQTDTDDDETESQSNEASIKLMCEFWNILKEDPNCNLPLAVKRKMGIRDQNSSGKGKFGPKKLSCFMARGIKDKDKKEEESCCSDKNKEQEDSSSKCCNQKEVKENPTCCNSSNDNEKSSNQAKPTCCSSVPLNKALCNLKQAVSFDKKCEDRIQELQQAQEELTAKVKTLEQREKQGTQMLNQADQMWNKMENEYKMKIESSILKQNELIKHLKEVEKSKTKWRKNKKDLELQMTSLNKCSDEIKEKMNQKTNDMKCMELEIADFKKRIEIHARDTDSTQKSLTTRKASGDKKVQKYMSEIEQLQRLIDEENLFKKRKEEEGNRYIRVAREDLQKLCRMQLQKKLESEDLISEKEGIEHEILFLQQTYDNCKDKCNTKKLNLQEELKKIDKEIKSHRNKCIKCHRYTDTSDIRKLCIDCPKCKKDRECKTVDDHCVFDPSFDCVCMATKRNFLNNVFENMYTVLARNSKSNAGKAVAEHILQNLHRSRNGKLNAESKRLLQDFILTVVKNNLNLTIVGGAVKTRCEMDADTYKQLMSCLTSVKVEKPTKTDKGTVVMKEPCRRWGGETECHCPKGPSGCICNRKLPPSGIKKGTSTKEVEMESEMVMCPRDMSADQKGPVCSVECGARHPSSVWQPSPCGPSPCFGQRSRTVQCAMGNEPRMRSAPPPPAHAARPAPAPPAPPAHPAPPAPPAPVRPSRPRDIVVPISGKKNGEKQKQNFFFKSDRSSATREKIVEEVIGQFEDEMSDESVKSFGLQNAETKLIEKLSRCNCGQDNSRIIEIDRDKMGCQCDANIYAYENKNKNASNYRVFFSNKIKEKTRPFSDNESYVNETVLNNIQSRFQREVDVTENSLKTKKSEMSNEKEIDRRKSKCSRVCDVVNELLTDIIVTGDQENYNKFESDVEWMRVNSLVNQLSSNKIDVDNSEQQQTELKQIDKLESSDISTIKPIKYSRNKRKIESNNYNLVLWRREQRTKIGLLEYTDSSSQSNSSSSLESNSWYPYKCEIKRTGKYFEYL